MEWLNVFIDEWRWCMTVWKPVTEYHQSTQYSLSCRLCRVNSCVARVVSVGMCLGILTEWAMFALRWFLSFLIISLSPFISGSTRPIFTIFYRMKALWVQMIDLNVFFLISQGTSPWQTILWRNQQTHHARMRPVISDNIGPIFKKFSDLVEKWMQIINPPFVLWSLKLRCYGNQFSDQTI